MSEPAAVETDTWGALRLQVSTYLTRTLPATLALVSSVRAIVLRGGEVLVARDPTRRHILPGGRREAGETVEQTLRREVREETGWEIGPGRLIGLLHFHHLTERPAEYRYPYPDFLHLVYAASGVRCDPAARVADDYELEAVMVPLDGAEALPLMRGERALLAAALAVELT
jgi:8-oxo-dGTP pyrophosphatase MutT (NUDIX family)